MKFVKCLTGLALAGALATPALAQDPTFFRIGTGGAGGTYFPIGGTIANGISAPPGSRPCEEGGQCGVPGLIAIAQSTTASVFNNAAVQNGELEAGLAAADVTRSMYLGEGKFEGKPHPNLRIVANLCPRTCIWFCQQVRRSMIWAIWKASVSALHKPVPARRLRCCRCWMPGASTVTIWTKPN